MSRRARGARDRGTAGLEFVGLLPLLLLAATFALQAGAAMWAASSTSESVREAARAYSLGQDPALAAQRSLPGGLRVDAISYPGPAHAVRLTVKVPRVSLLPDFTVTREAVLP